MDAGITPDDVPKDSIRGMTQERVAAARAAGRRLRVVCTAALGEAAGHHGAPPGDGIHRDGSPTPAGAAPAAPVRAAVRLTELAPGHPLFSAGGSTLSVLLHTDLMGTVQSPSATPYPTRPPTRSTPTCWPSTKAASRRTAKGPADAGYSALLRARLKRAMAAAFQSTWSLRSPSRSLNSGEELAVAWPITLAAPMS